MVQQKSTILTLQQEKFIDFVASGQLNLELKKLSYEEFAASHGVDRSTLYNWRKTIPGFWEIVALRSSDIIDRRLPRIMNAMFAKAMKGDVAAARLLLNQANRLKPIPTEDSAVGGPTASDYIEALKNIDDDSPKAITAEEF